jgi:arylsulfatase A-like enzyme
MSSMSKEHKNILIIMSDEQSWDTLGCHGNPSQITPNLDALAAQGVSFDRCYTAYPLCCPARASLWTGLMPHGHQVTGNWRSIREDLRDVGLASNFKQAGYHLIYTGKWHVPGTTPARFGYDDISAIPAVLEGRDRGRFIEEYRDYARAQGYVLHETHVENLTEADIAKMREPGKAPCGAAEIAEEHFLETWQTGKFLEALERRPADKPFFAVCSYNAPHFPMIVPKPFDTLVDPNAVRLPGNFLTGLESKPSEVRNSAYARKLQGIDESEWRRFIALYLGLCALIDKQVGRIVDYLKEGGLFENTIVVFLSDHGDMMGAHGLVEKGFPLHYEEALRVPLIIANAPSGAAQTQANPQSAAQSRSSDALVSLIDLIPTLAEAVGVPIAQTIDGRSFTHALANPRQAAHRDAVLAETFKLGVEENAGVGGESLSLAHFREGADSLNVSVRTNRWRYIFRYKDIEELYDTENDPLENVNLAGDSQYAATLADLRSTMLNELRQTANSAEAIRLIEDKLA